MRDVLEAIKAMGNQMVTLTQMFTPLVNSFVGQAGTIPTAVPLAGGPVEQGAEVIEIDPPDRATKRMDYLKLMEHISKLGTKHYNGSVDPLEADATRCPDDYKQDVAVHFLEGDAHSWWLALDKRTNGTIERFSDFVVEFNHNYLPAGLGLVWRLSSWTWSRVAGRFESMRRSSTDSGAMCGRNWRTSQFRYVGS